MANRTSGALLQHMMMAKQKQFMEKAVRAVTGPRADIVPSSEEAGIVHMTETRIYVGLNDAETREQQYETKKYLDVLKDVCRSYKVAFSVDIEEGGYYHEDGEYTDETSLVLVLIDADGDIVKKIAGDLRRLFNQESVLVTKNRVDGCFIVD